MGLKHKIHNTIVSLHTMLIVMSLFVLIAPSANAIDTQQWNQCHQQLAREGYAPQKRSDFCRRPNSHQWTCAQIILKKYHSLEMAQETCLSARSSEIQCFNRVLDRNFDPYIAKQVCRLK